MLLPHGMWKPRDSKAVTLGLCLKADLNVILQATRHICHTPINGINDLESCLEVIQDYTFWCQSKACVQIYMGSY